MSRNEINNLQEKIQNDRNNYNNIIKDLQTQCNILTQNIFIDNSLQTQYKTSSKRDLKKLEQSIDNYSKNHKESMKEQENILIQMTKNIVKYEYRKLKLTFYTKGIIENNLLQIIFEMSEVDIPNYSCPGMDNNINVFNRFCRNGMDNRYNTCYYRNKLPYIPITDICYYCGNSAHDVYDGIFYCH